MKRIGWVIGMIVFISFVNDSIVAQIVQDQTKVLLKLTPRPSEHTAREREVFFDQQAVLRVTLKASQNAVTNSQAQCIFLFDEIQTTGKIKRKAFTDIVSCKLLENETKFFDSQDLRLTGKITRSGQIVGMKFIGSGTRLYENGNLIYELYEPLDCQKEIATLVPPLDQKSIQEPVIVKNEPSSLPLKPVSSADSENKSESGLELFGYKFTAEEADKILQSVNGLPEEALVSQIGLSKQAAHNLVLKRPFKKLDELPKVSYVKKQAVETLKLYVLKK